MSVGERDSHSTVQGESSADTIVLSARNVEKSYGGVQALKGVGFDLRAGEVHGLCGENGSGKSTLLKIISGQITSDAGRVELYGEEVSFKSPVESLAFGIKAVTQERTLVPSLSVAENVFLGHQKSRKWYGVDWKVTKARAKEVLDRLGCDVDVEAIVSDLAPGDAQMVEIARAICTETKVLILDEPTSSLTAHEVSILFKSIRNLSAQGVATVFISHRMEEIFEICDRLTVLRDGGGVSADVISNYTEEKLISDMTGKAFSLSDHESVQAESREVALRVEALSLPFRFQDVNLNLQAGEILGIIGLVGAGHSELLESIFGLHAEVSGEVLIHGRKHRISSPRLAMKAGLAFVPADRKRHGLVLDMSVFENAIMASTAKFFRLITPKPAKEARFVDECVADFGITMASVDANVSSLSGGNQQKVLLTKWLGTKPKVLLLDEPTRGVDVGAKAEIYRILQEQRAKGLSILVSSSEVPELLILCDRILVMHRGRIVADLKSEHANETNLVAFAMGQGMSGKVQE
ncbi:MAG: sugar ABC transporter ATP-binding protein [Actinomycetes bacterium]